MQVGWTGCGSGRRRGHGLRCGCHRGSRRRFGLGRRCGFSSSGFQGQDGGALGDLVANLDGHGFDGAGMGGRDVHRCLVGLQRDQRVVDVDAVTDFDVDFDDVDAVEIADVGDKNFYQMTHDGFLIDAAIDEDWAIDRS